MAKVKIFPGMKEVIKELSESYILIIISSTISSPIKEFLERNNISGFFEQFAGDNIVHSDKVERMKKAIGRHKVLPRDCIFITDTLGDMKEAKKCGIVSIGVLWGFHKRENLLKANPFKVVDKPDDIPFSILEYFNLADIPNH